MTSFLIITILLILLIEGIPLFINKMWKEFTCVILLLCVAALIQIGSSIGMLTGIGFIEKLLKPIGEMYLKKL